MGMQGLSSAERALGNEEAVEAGLCQAPENEKPLQPSADDHHVPAQHER